MIKHRKKKRKKKGEEKREGRDALLITEPSAKSWRVANSTGSWDRGMGEGGGREEGRGGRRGGGRHWVDVWLWRGTEEAEIGCPESKCGRGEKKKKRGTIRTIKLWDEFPERIWQAGRNVAIK